MANEAAVLEAPTAVYDTEEADPVAPAANEAVDTGVTVKEEEPPVTDEPPAPVETKAEKVLRLKELRKQDSEEFDEDAIETTVNEAKALKEARERDYHLYETDPDFKESYLKAIIKKGYTPNTDEQAFLDSRKPAPVKTDAPPRYTRKVVYDTIAAETAKMESEGRPISYILAYRDSMIERWINDPEREDAKAAVEKETASRTAREAKAAADAKVHADAVGLRSSAAAASKAFGDIWVKDPRYLCGYRCTDKAVYEIVASLNEPLDVATRMALAKMNRLRTAAPAPKPTGVRPVIQNQKVAKKEKVDPKYFVEE